MTSTEQISLHWSDIPEKAMRTTLEWPARLRDEVKPLREMELDTLEAPAN